MNRHILTRIPGEQFTRGILSTDPGKESNQTFFTLELPWLNNQHQISCIPTGIYTVEFLSISANGEFNDIYHVKDVSDRDGILIHAGNYLRDTHGCILIGMGWNTNEQMLVNSQKALNKFRGVVGEEPFELQIKWYQPEEIKVV